MSAAWQSVLETSRVMLAAARLGAFDQVAALEMERRPLLERLPPATAEVRESLIELLECEREIGELVDAARRHTGDLLREARRAQACAGAYAGIAFGR